MDNQMIVILILLPFFFFLLLLFSCKNEKMRTELEIKNLHIGGRNPNLPPEIVLRNYGVLDSVFASVVYCVYYYAY
jgi:hypothetical protein